MPEQFTKELLIHSQSLKYYALNLTGNIEEAEDLLQETLLKALNNKDKFNAGTNLKAWLYTIMRNIFINNYNRNAKANTIVDKTQNLYYLNLPQQNSATAGESRLTEQLIRQKIEELSDEYKTPFMLFFNGFKYKEIADQLDLPLGTVKSRIFLARKELMHVLKELI